MHPMQLFDGFDLSILAMLSGWAGQSRLFDHLISAVSRLDVFKGVALMCLFWYVWAGTPANESIAAREQRHNRLTTILIGTILIGALSRGLQLALNVHQRPLLSNLGLAFAPTGFDALSLNRWNSFPSDHAMFFFALGAGLYTVNRAAGLIACLWTILVIDFPRVYLGIHYPTDVIFGGLFGFLGMKLFLALPLRRIERLMSGWRHAHQGLFLALLFFVTDEVGHLLGELRDLAQSSVRILIN
jgi:undecaprenyl-diphosphatase